MIDEDIDRDRIHQIFAKQCEESLGVMEKMLVTLESRPADEDALRTIFRICHTTKGDSAALGFHKLSHFTHVLEDLFERLRSGALVVTPDLIALLLEAVDAMRKMVAGELRGGDDACDDHVPLLLRIRESTGIESD